MVRGSGWTSAARMRKGQQEGGEGYRHVQCTKHTKKAKMPFDPLGKSSALDDSCKSSVLEGRRT